MNKTIEEKYVKQTQHEHIYKKPDTYIGSIESDDTELWVFNDVTDKIIKKVIKYVPGLYKIYDEILVNARDHAVRCSKCKVIKVNISDDGLIEVWNDGPGIEVVIHKEHNIYVPQMIFGELLTSSNYDDLEKKIVGGKNGYGAKLTNIFSTEFTIETVDAERKLKYVQKFENNMWTKHEPVITKSTNSSYTKISFIPDFKKFGLSNLSIDMLSLMKKRVYDLSQSISGTKVYYNDNLINIKQFDKYVDYFFDTEINKVCDLNDRWKVCAIFKPECGYQQISHVNGINTVDGGTHVDYITNQVIKHISEIIGKKKIVVKPAQVKEHLMIFVDCVIENPNFSSQSKVLLTSKVSSFGSKCVLSDKFLKKIASSGIVELLIEWTRAKDNLGMKKTDGKKLNSIRGIPKLEDAHKAGTVDSKDCSLILTEGDSAKALVIAGLSVIGKEYYGVFPLKGKLLNVRQKSLKVINENEEIVNIKKIMGLQHGKQYTDVSKLRYGRIIIFTDQDTDGSHIKGLIMNFIQFFWPTLVMVENFIQCMTTPVVKVSKGNKVISFYNLTEYENWTKENNSGYKTKYYKGLGTSTAMEAREYFANFNESLISYCWTDEIDNQVNKNEYSLNMAFAKEKESADIRKEWLSSYDRNDFLNNNNKQVPFHEFINKELIHFSNDDNERSIPNIMDGLKISTRKIMYTCIKRKLTSSLKVAQLAGSVAEKSNYHHGEKSLVGAIIKMAHNYIGSNNINLLEPEGQFGTRLKGGKDHASERYIFTKLSVLVNKLFREEDKDILTYLEDDGDIVEPEWYCPIIPMILVNGTEGIGTGWSTNIPSYNPLDIIKNLKYKMANKEMKHMKPWYKFFKGDIIKSCNNKYTIFGNYTQLDNNTIEITELPIEVWTDDYKEFLEESIIGSNNGKKEFIKTYESNSSDVTISFIVKFPDDKLNEYITKGILMDKLKLIKTISTNNMHLHNADRSSIVKYDSPEDIIEEFYTVRIDMYQSRKDNLIIKYESELKLLYWKVLFMKYVIDKKIIIFKQPRLSIESKLEELGFPRLDLEQTYNYLMNIKIDKFTKEEIDKLDNDYALKQEELNILKNKSVTDLWTADLDEFSDAYQDWYNSCLNEYELLSSQKTVSKGKKKRGKK